MFLLLLLLHRLTLIIPPPPNQKNWQNCRFVSLKTFVKSAQNRLLSSEICPKKFPRKWLLFNDRLSVKFVPNFSAKSAVFTANLSLKIPRNLTFFLRPIRGPVFWTVYVIKVLDLVAFFSLPPPPTFFPSPTSIMSNLHQSYSEKVNVWITLEATNPIFDRTLTVDRPLFQALHLWIILKYGCPPTCLLLY